MSRRNHVGFVAAHIAFFVFALVFFCWALPALITYLIGPA